MSVYRHQYLVEMQSGQEQRQVDADTCTEVDGWLIFSRLPPQGGRALEYWRARTDVVACMTTLRN